MRTGNDAGVATSIGKAFRDGPVLVEPGKSSPIPWHGAVTADPGYVYAVRVPAHYGQFQDTIVPGLCFRCVTIEVYRHTVAAITWHEVPADLPIGEWADCAHCERAIGPKRD